jgi:hypothetical protein
MKIRYRVDLSQDEREQLTALLSGGKHPARKIKRAQILLAVDGGIGDDATAAGASVGRSLRIVPSVASWRATFRAENPWAKLVLGNRLLRYSVLPLMIWRYVRD